MNYALVQNGSWWQDRHHVLWALVGSGHGVPCSARVPRPASWMAPLPGPSVFLWGQLELHPPPHPWAISLPTAQHVMAVSGINTRIRGWTQPTEAGPWFSWHVLAAASMQNGQDWASQRVGEAAKA